MTERGLRLDGLYDQTIGLTEGNMGLSGLYV